MRSLEGRLSVVRRPYFFLLAEEAVVDAKLTEWERFYVKRIERVDADVWNGEIELEDDETGSDRQVVVRTSYESAQTIRLGQAVVLMLEEEED